MRAVFSHNIDIEGGKGNIKSPLSIIYGREMPSIGEILPKTRWKKIIRNIITNTLVKL